MARFPWSELGLQGPADERAIRRAYAARLKTVRPDVDAAGFQRLVQARDIALRMMAAPTGHAHQRPIVPANLVPALEESRVPDDTPRPDRAPDPPPDETTAPVIIDLEPPVPPPLAGANPELRSAGSGFDSPMPKAADPEAVSKLLSDFVTAWTADSVLPPVAPILKELGEQSMTARQKLEIDALRAVAMLLDKRLFDRKARAARQAAARSLIVGLDDEYAWTLNDRRLHAMMPFKDAADQTVRLLRIVREWQRTGSMPNLAPPRQRKAPNWLTTLGVIMLVGVGIRGINWAFTTKSSTPNSTSFATVPNLQQANQAAFFFSRGVAYDRAGEVDKAISEYDQAIRLDPKHALAFYNRGLGYARKGQFDRAIQDYDDAIRLNPASADSFVSRGVAFDAKGDYDLAISNYDEAIRLKPGYGLAYVNRGIAYANKEQYGRAIKDYDQAIRLDPNDRDALYNRGQAKRASGDAAGGDVDIAKSAQLASAPAPKAAMDPGRPSK